jgi:hypothetical protein
MFDRKLADHLVIGDLDALVGRDATLIAAMTPQLPYRAVNPRPPFGRLGQRKAPAWESGLP